MVELLEKLETSGPVGRAGHIILSGMNQVAIATLAELRRRGEVVVVVSEAPDKKLAAKVKELGGELLEGRCLDPSVLAAAEVASAETLILTEDDDIGNLHAALAAQELNPMLRIVMRIFNHNFGAKVQELFPDCTALSASAIAAPFFVTEALGVDPTPSACVDGRTITVQRALPQAANVILPLIKDDGTVFPADSEEAYCLVDEGSAAWHAKPKHSPLILLGNVASSLVGLFLATDPRLRKATVFLVAFAIVNAAVFHWFGNLSILDALYFTMTVITTIGFGDFNLQNASPPMKIYGIVFMISGAGTLALFFALITDMVVGTSIREVLGKGRHRRMKGHIVVCGLGNVGYRIVEQLARERVEVAAVEAQGSSNNIQAARRLGVHVVTGDSRLEETLSELHVGTASCLIVATNDDVANLETALNVRAINPKLRVVLRLYDPDFAKKVDRVFGFGSSHSVSALAGPPFAEAALGHKVLATFVAGGNTIIIAETTAEAESAAVGKRVADCENSTGTRILMKEEGKIYRPSADAVVAGGTELLLVAPNTAISRGLAAFDHRRRIRGIG